MIYILNRITFYFKIDPNRTLNNLKNGKNSKEFQKKMRDAKSDAIK